MSSRRTTCTQLAAAVFILLIFGLAGCAPQALVSERYEPSFYEVPRELPDSLTSDTTRFVVIGDIQSGWRAERKFYRRANWATWKQLLVPFYQVYLIGNGFVGALNYKMQLPDYGTQGRAIMRQAIREEVDEEQAGFYMILGDIALHDGRRPAHWASFLREYRSPESELVDLPLLPVLGNHEYANDSTGMANYRAVFDYEPFYVQDMPNAALFVVNSNYIIDQHNFLDDETQDALFEEWFVSSDTSSELAWLERELQERADRPFKMIAMHHPLITLSWHSEDWYEAHHGPDLIEKRQRLLRLLQRYDVQVVFSGHEHLYEHNMLRYRGGQEASLIHQVITSGGGVPIRPAATSVEMDARMAQYEREDLDVFNVMQRETYHFTTVEVAPDTLRVDTYGVEPQPPYESYLIDRILIPTDEPPADASQAVGSAAAGQQQRRFFPTTPPRP